MEQDVAQLKQQIQLLSAQIQQLQTNSNQRSNISAKLNNYIDQTTRDTINSVHRQNYYQVSTVVLAGFTLLPQSQYIKVSGTAARTSSTGNAISNGAWIGQELFIEGTDNTNTVTFKDAANTQLAGDCALGIYDTLTVVWNGTYWIEKCRSNN